MYKITLHITDPDDFDEDFKFDTIEQVKKFLLERLNDEISYLDKEYTDFDELIKDCQEKMKTDDLFKNNVYFEYDGNENDWFEIEFIYSIDDDISYTYYVEKIN